jgi:predicted enzyme related to lactoylglutathione lyase
MLRLRDNLPWGPLGKTMISAVHTVIYTKQAEAVRAFFRDVLEFPFVDAGGGWLIYALPPGELGIHPTDSDDEHGHHNLYLMCDDIEATVAQLKAKGVEFTRPIKNAGFGLLTALKLPDGTELHLYEPRHASPLNPPVSAPPNAKARSNDKFRE